MALLIGLSYVAGGWLGWTLMDKFFKAQARKREEREALMRDVTPR